MRKENTQKTYVSIKNNAKDKPQFFIDWKEYWSIWGIITSIGTEKKQITPKSWENAWKKITVYNLLLDIVDEDGVMTLQIPLYSSYARHIMNTLAWDEKLAKVYFSVYLNKGYRSISIKASDDREADWIKWLYTRDEMKEHVWEKVEKWETKPDYDVAVEKYVEELLPIIEKKIDDCEEVVPWATTMEDIESSDEEFADSIEQEAKEKSDETGVAKEKATEDDRLPF